MPTEQQLEQYLNALDKALGQIPISDRADILTEIKSHILEAKERDPEQNIGKILASLGEAETVANRYLLERGLKPGKPPKSPMIKWLTIGFLGTFGILALLIFALIWKFTPIIKVDEKAGTVKLLGGVIDIQAEFGGSGQWGINFNRGDGQDFSGSVSIKPGHFEKIFIPFKNGKLSILPAIDQNLKWDCKVEGDPNSAFVSEKDKTFTLNMEKTKGSKCEIYIPDGIATQIEGLNGKLMIVEPRANMEVNLLNGKIGISPDPDRKYRYETHVVNGRVAGLESSTAKDAVLIRVSVTNGVISKD